MSTYKWSACFRIVADQCSDRKPLSAGRTKAFNPPSRANDTKLNFDIILSFARELISKYSLNSDQADALLHCAAMFNQDKETASPVLLIHGERQLGYIE